MEIVRGMETPYPWPRMFGLLTPNSFDVIVQAIIKEPECNLTPKLDGSLLSVSSKGYMASKGQVIAFEGDDLKEITFQGVTLEHCGHHFEKSKQLHKILKKKFKTLEETIVTGEFLQEGTACCRRDIYNYKDKNFKAGHMYSFAVTLVKGGPVIDDDDVSCDPNEIWNKSVLRFFGQGKVYGGKNNKKKHIIIPTNDVVESFFERLEFDFIPLIDKSTFHRLLLNKDNIYQVNTRKTEGFVLSWGQEIIKWKPFEEEKDDRHNQYLEELSDRMDHYYEMNQVDKSDKSDESDDSDESDGSYDCNPFANGRKVVKMLQDMYDLSEDYMRKKTARQLYKTWYRSNLSKCRLIEYNFKNAADESMEDLVGVAEKYEKRIKDGIFSDFEEQHPGKIMEPITKAEMEIFVENKIKELAHQTLRNKKFN